MSDINAFTLGDFTFETVVCTDPSTGEEGVWVYRTDGGRRDLVATGEPDALILKPPYAIWGENVAVLEQAVMDSIEGAAA
jgi:hypothetical protein